MNDLFFMDKALEQARLALRAGEFPVGCVLVYQNRVIETGSRKGSAISPPNEVDHAEMVAIRKLAVSRPNIDRKQISLYCTMEPCLMCYAASMLMGIGRIVYAYEDVMGGGTGCDLSKTSPLYQKCDITIVPHIRREKSLDLFKAYFANPENDYWQNSILSKFTLRQ